MKIMILYLLLISILCTGCRKNTSVSDIPIDFASTINNEFIIETIEPSSTPQPTKVIDVPLQETYPEIDEIFRKENSEAKKNELLRSYKVIDHQLYYIFSKDDINLTFPANTGGEYTLKVNEDEAIFHWPITYYPGSKAWFTAELIDVTNDGIKDLCVRLYLGSGSGMSVSGFYVVDLCNMNEISLTHEDNYSLKASDAKKINDMLLDEKKNYDYLDWITETPISIWNIMSFGLKTTGEIQLYLGLCKDGYGEWLGNICGTYIYQNDDFILDKVWFEPEYISIYDGYEPIFKDVVDGYGNEIVTASNFEQISLNEIKRIHVTYPFGEGNIFIFEGLDYKIYSGYQLDNAFYQMETLDDPHNYNIIKDAYHMEKFIDSLINPTSISEYEHLLDQSGVVLTVGLGNSASTTYYYYDKKAKRPMKLVSLNTSWEAIDLDADGSNELISRDNQGSYQYSFIINTKDGIKYLNFSTYRLSYNKEKMYFERGEDGAKFKFDGLKFVEIY